MPCSPLLLPEFRVLARIAFSLLVTISLNGCFSPMAIDHLSQAYNQVTADDISKQLLLNIARARHSEPIHFTGISNIAATLNYQGSIGATPPLTGDIGLSLMPLLGGAVSENPTITFVPLQGEEFTKRLLSPITEDKLTLLLRQNTDIDLLLRLLALEFRTEINGQDVVFHNRPRDNKDYESFRRIVLHLSAIQDQDLLFAEPLIMKRSITLPAENLTAEGLEALEKTHRVTYDPKQKLYQIVKEEGGPIVLTNYNPSKLSEAERQRLSDETGRSADNEILVDIRPGFAGGELPVHGQFRLRSFSNVLYFLGRNLSSEKEYHVDPDPRTPKVNENPDSVMMIRETEKPLKDAAVGVEYRDKYYAIEPNKAYPWNENAFRILWQLFQMTVVDLPRVGTPSLTIAK